MAIIVITGANRGIGRELARLWVAAGDRVITGNRAGVASAPGAEVLALDVTDGASVKAFAAALDGVAVDVLVNNAGTIGPDRQSAETWTSRGSP